MPRSLAFDLRSRIQAAIEADLSGVERFGVSAGPRIDSQALHRRAAVPGPSRKAGTGR